MGKVNFKWCDHDLKIGAAMWVDTGGGEWREDECKKCGRLWRMRLTGFVTRKKKMRVLTVAA